MDALVGPFAMVAAVVAVGGLFKLWNPEPTSAMFASIGLPRSALLARGSGALELVVGAAAVLVGGRLLAGLVALAYVVFAATAWRLVVLGDASASCGCFGALSSGVTWLHVVVDLAAAAVALVAVVLGVPGLVESVGDQPGAGLPLVGLVALGAWLLVAVMTVLPDTLLAARRTAAVPSIDEFGLR